MEAPLPRHSPPLHRQLVAIGFRLRPGGRRRRERHHPGSFGSLPAEGARWWSPVGGEPGQAGLAKRRVVPPAGQIDDVGPAGTTDYHRCAGREAVGDVDREPGLEASEYVVWAAGRVDHHAEVLTERTATSAWPAVRQYRGCGCRRCPAAAPWSRTGRRNRRPPLPNVLWPGRGPAGTPVSTGPAPRDFLVPMDCPPRHGAAPVPLFQEGRLLVNFSVGRTPVPGPSRRRRSRTGARAACRLPQRRCLPR